MSRIDDIFNQLNGVAKDAKQIVKKQKEQGKKVVGILPVYAPEELVHAAGMFPVGCWGGQVAISKAAKYLPPFACSIMQAVMEFAEDGTYQDVDAYLVSTPCDTLKAISQNLIFASPDKKVIILSHPQNNKSKAAVPYVTREYEKVKAALEELGGKPITDDEIAGSIDIYNRHRAAMMEFYRIAAEKPGLVSAVARHGVAKSGYFMLKEDHTALLEELNELLKAEPAPDWGGYKIILAGIMAEPDALLELFDEAGLSVAGDELAQESRQFRTLVPEGGTPIGRLANQWVNMGACSVIWDAEKKRAKHIVSLAKETDADAVIYCQMKFCDPEEFDYPSVMKACGEAGIPLLNLEVEQTTESVEQARTRIQAYSEMIKANRRGVKQA
jgi:benzoyl-CoA reductase/2-hydroxyglutaryl-CoA dehydratase subunit BcrC/BadD/HgdB